MLRSHEDLPGDQVVDYHFRKSFRLPNVKLPERNELLIPLVFLGCSWP